MRGAVTAQSVPTLRRGIRRHYDTVRAQNVLLCPERVILLDDIANAIAELCDAERSVAEISRILAERYSEDPARVEADVISFIEELADKGLVTT
jgi:pyrroloquinoline quinone biosynthesis protein D